MDSVNVPGLHIVLNIETRHQSGLFGRPFPRQGREVGDALQPERAFGGTSSSGIRETSSLLRHPAADSWGAAAFSFY